MFIKMSFYDVNLSFQIFQVLERLTLARQIIKISRFVSKQMEHFYVHKIPPLLSAINPVNLFHILMPCLSCFQAGSQNCKTRL